MTDESRHVATALLVGTAGAAAREAAAEHLAGCRVCGGELAAWEAVRGGVREAAGRLPDPGPALLDGVWARVDRRAALPGRHRRRTWRLRLGVGAAAMAAAAAALVAVDVVPRGPSPGRPEGQPPARAASAAEALHAAAAVAAVQPDARLQPGQYWYTRTLESHVTFVVETRGDRVLSSRVSVGKGTHEQWVDSGGRGWARDGKAGTTPMNGADRKRWQAVTAAAPPDEVPTAARRYPVRHDGSPGEYNGPFAGFSYEQLTRLPTDPAALRQRLLDAIGAVDTSKLGPPALAEAVDAWRHDPKARDTVLFHTAGGLLRSSPAPASVRAALYKVIAGIPGVRLLGETRDPLGRQGVAVAFNSPEERVELVFDPRTATLLSESRSAGPASFARRHDVVPAGARSWSAVVASGVADSGRQTLPAGHLGG